MITIKAEFDGKVFIPKEPVNLPEGCVLEISIADSPDASEPSALTKLAEIADRYPDNPDAPTDFAAQHDHFLYGTPKRT